MKAIVLGDFGERKIDVKYAVFYDFKMDILTFPKLAWRFFLVAHKIMVNVKINVILNLMN